MYKGIIKRKREEIKLAKTRDKYQILSNEQIEENKVITQNYIFKTKEYKVDPTIKFTDFEISNLQGAGIDPRTLPTTILEADVEKLHDRAERAEDTLDRYEIYKQIEMEEKQNATTTEQTQQ